MVYFVLNIIVRMHGYLRVDKGNYNLPRFFVIFKNKTFFLPLYIFIVFFFVRKIKKNDNKKITVK